MTDGVRIGDLHVDAADLSPAQARAIVAARDRQLAAAPEPDVALPARPVLLARVAACTLAVPLEAIAAVVATPPTNAVPGAPPHHLGLFVRAGSAVNLLAIEAALSLEAGSRAVALVLVGEEPRIALAVDEALGVGQVPVRDRVGSALAPRVSLVDGREVSEVALAPLLAALGLGARDAA